MSIVLFGMPLSGKTTIGRKMAKNLSIKHIDLDKKIEDSYGDNIYNIFLNLGEKKFRKIEHDCLKTIKIPSPHILSVGGGAANKLNYSIIHSYSNRVWLDCSLSVIFDRINISKEKRPLLYNTSSLMTRLEELYDSRKICFNDLSNIKINTASLGEHKIAKEIILKINELN